MTQKILDPVAGFLYKPGTEVKWTNHLEFWATARVNSLGFLDAEPELPKPAGRLRILLVGDSFVEGAQVSLSEKLQTRLARELDATMGAGRADVVAFGHSGTGQANQLGFYERFGKQVLQADGQLDRAALRVRVFGHDAERRALEAILHPAIRRRLEQICRQATSPYAIATVPLLAEGGGRAAYPWLHRILVVDTPTEVQKRRLMQRDGIDAVLAEKMMAAQASRAVRLALADDIVVNDGDIAHLQRAADDLHRRYLALAEAGNTHSMANNRPL